MVWFNPHSTYQHRSSVFAATIEKQYFLDILMFSNSMVTWVSTEINTMNHNLYVINHSALENDCPVLWLTSGDIDFKVHLMAEALRAQGLKNHIDDIPPVCMQCKQ